MCKKHVKFPHKYNNTSDKIVQFVFYTSAHRVFKCEIDFTAPHNGK